MIKDRIRNAFHEAGHAVAAYAVHRPIELVSIRPGETFSGIATFGRARLNLDPLRFGAPAFLQPCEIRRRIESHIVVDLAGTLAADMAVRLTGYVPTEPDVVAAETAMKRLSEVQRERLHVLERDPEPTVTDEEQAYHFAAVVDQSTVAYLSWLREATKLLLQEPWNMRALERLADELLRQEVVTGRQARSIIRQAIQEKRFEPPILLAAESKEE